MLSIKPDHWIRQQAQERSMIEPFEDRQVREGMVSYGLSSFGYDIRVAKDFRIFTPATGELTVIDPKAVDERALQSYHGDDCIIPPNSFALARTIEYFRIPRNVLAICVGKSTYARCGIIVNVTPFEPEWEGYVTIEISNTTPPARPHLRRRRHRPGPLFRRRSAGSLLRRPQRQIPETVRHHPASFVKKLFKRGQLGAIRLREQDQRPHCYCR